MAADGGARRSARAPPTDGEDCARQAGSDSCLFSKTRLCKFFLSGYCSHGTTCTFAHGEEQLQPRPDFFRSRLCLDYQKTGACRHGSECRFAHAVEQLRPANLRRRPGDERPPSLARPVVADVAEEGWGEEQCLPVDVIMLQLQELEQQAYRLQSQLLVMRSSLPPGGCSQRQKAAPPQRRHAPPLGAAAAPAPLRLPAKAGVPKTGAALQWTPPADHGQEDGGAARAFHVVVVKNTFIEVEAPSESVAAISAARSRSSPPGAVRPAARPAASAAVVPAAFP